MPHRTISEVHQKLNRGVFFLNKKCAVTIELYSLVKKSEIVTFIQGNEAGGHYVK